MKYIVVMSQLNLFDACPVAKNIRHSDYIGEQSRRNKQLLYDLFQAYYDARKNKRHTINALKFEINYESELLKLYEEIINKTYKIKSSICFINFSPVKREIFAADFRDRIVHHLIYNYIAPFFERQFINDSYSCRIGKGTSYGIKRLNHFIRSCSLNYTTDCYILKLDIEGYFMAMNRTLLFNQIKKQLLKYSQPLEFDMHLILYLIEKVIFNDPVNNCTIKGSKNDWKGLPKTKSLFYEKIQYWNNFIKELNYKLNKEDLKLFLSSINSYLGILKHYNTYKLRKKMLLHNLSAYFWNYVYISGGYSKLVLKIRPVKN